MINRVKLQEKENKLKLEYFKQQHHYEKCITTLILDPDCGVLNTNAKIVVEQVDILIQRIAAVINESDPLLECEFILEGSMKEETKICKSDEFDYNVHLKTLSNLQPSRQCFQNRDIVQYEQFVGSKSMQFDVMDNKHIATE